MTEQPELGLTCCLNGEQQFAAWKQRAGSRQILRQCYREAARYGERYKATGRQVSMRLVYELVRDKIGAVRERCKRRGMDLKQWDGYTMPNVLAPSIARHIEARRPEWRGMFRKSSVGRARRNRRVIVIDSTRKAG